MSTPANTVSNANVPPRPALAVAMTRSSTPLLLALPTLLLLLCGGASGAALFERPVPPGGGPTEVRCAIAVLDLDEINDARQNFTVNFYGRFEWHDPREAHAGEGKIVKPLGEIWHPRLLFVNMQRSWSSIGGDVEISPDGTVVLRQQYWGDIAQPMNLHDFPFDEQVFSIQVVAAGPEEFGELAFAQDPEIPSSIAKKYSVADWQIIAERVSSDPLVMATGDRVEAFAFVFTAKRLAHHYVIKIIAPLVMIVVLSFVVFWLDPVEGASQLAVSVTSVLTVIAYHISLSARLPEISYLTRFDVFVFGATLMVCLAMIEVVVTTGLARTGRLDRARLLDRGCRVGFPAGLILVGSYAFLWH
jgi:hypothetical protein